MAARSARPDTPVSFGYKCASYAMDTKNPEAVVAALGLVVRRRRLSPESQAAWYAGVVVHRTRRVSFMSLTLEQLGIDRLNPQQRLELLGLIWDSLPDDASFPSPDWHLRELERRVAAADADPGAAEPWEAVLARLSRKP
jgi:putative addiction module component (TIGR02574 family)